MLLSSLSLWIPFSGFTHFALFLVSSLKLMWKEQEIDFYFCISLMIMPPPPSTPGLFFWSQVILETFNNPKGYALTVLLFSILGSVPSPESCDSIYMLQNFKAQSVKPLGHTQQKFTSIWVDLTSSPISLLWLCALIIIIVVIIINNNIITIRSKFRHLCISHAATLRSQLCWCVGRLMLF